MAYPDPLFLVRQTGIPLISAPSGTIGANGSITLGTALAVTYGSCWMTFPAGALYANSAAGTYYCVMTSTTVGTAYNIVLGSNWPYIPADEIVARAAIVSASVGSYTGVTGSIAFTTVTVPGQAIGANGLMTVEFELSATTTANTRQVNFSFASTNRTVSVGSGGQIVRRLLKFANRGTTNRNFLSGLDQYTQTGAAPVASTSVATDQNWTITISGEKNVATDYVVIEYIIIDLKFAA